MLILKILTVGEIFSPFFLSQKSLPDVLWDADRLVFLAVGLIRCCLNHIAVGQ